jgi:ribosomal protein S18 acetylase RimI-like enzyme
MNFSVVTIEALSDGSDAVSIEAARALLLEYGRFVLESEGPARFCFGKLQDEIDGLPGGFIGLGGELLLAWVDGIAAGCLTYRALPAVSGGCEMKRLWVRPEFRGSGLGERLILELCERAGTAGYAAVYLDTMPASMGPAYRMYQRLGFAECAPYHVGIAEGVVFMRRELD